MSQKITPGEKFLYDKKIGPEAKTPFDIQKWLEATQRIIEKSKSEREGDKKLVGYLDRVKMAFHKIYIPNINNFPKEEFLKFKNQAAEQQGYGRIYKINSEEFEKEIETEIKSQKESLDEWIEYFTSSDSSSFPIWAKYWAFHGLVRMSGVQKIDPATNKLSFPKRETNTFGRFPELNREALAKAVEHIVTKVERGINLQEALKQESFRDVYSFYINELRSQTTLSELEITEGRWVKYRQGNDPEVTSALVKSLSEKNTGWCTAVKGTARNQLKYGDFYVYYSNSGSGKPNPRIAIRMEGRLIKEVRGIADSQNLDPVISGTSILDDKLSEFGPEGQIYKTRVEHMKRLTTIKKKFDKGGELSIEDLKFLREVDEKIQGFGYTRDPRIDEILKGRDIKTDLSIIFGVAKDKISTSKNEALKGGFLIHVGELNLGEETGERSFLKGLLNNRQIILPEIVTGDLVINRLISTERIKLPKVVRGNLYLRYLKAGIGLKLPEIVGGTIALDNLGYAEDLEFPKSVEWLNLNRLERGKNIVLPKIIKQSLSLSSLSSAEGIQFPDIVYGDLDLPSLLNQKELSLPNKIGGDLVLGLLNAKGLKLPDKIGGNLILTNLEDSSELNIPGEVAGFVYLKQNIKNFEEIQRKYPKIKFKFFKY
jgi:hypothetical protein